MIEVRVSIIGTDSTMCFLWLLFVLVVLGYPGGFQWSESMIGNLKLILGL